MDDAERAARALSFGQVADAYDRYRPGYPDALLDEVLALAPASGRAPRVLEAGAGTGRATLALAGRGADVVAVEPDPGMAEVLTARVAGLPVGVVVTPFGEYRPEAGSADVVVSAQAWHWVGPAGGAAVAARALGPGGSLAVWWNRPRELTDPVWEAIDAVYAEHAPALRRRDQVHTHARPEVTLEPAEGFGAWTVLLFDWETAYDAASYTGLLATFSDHIRLPPAQREPLLAAVAAAIEDAGGEARFPYRTHLLHAPPA